MNSNKIYRTEYPRPQFQRDSYICLNGEWDFEIDYTQSGEEREFNKDSKVLNSKINVPFCPESKLSGIGHVDFMPCVWYKKKIALQKSGKRILLHFGGVDYLCRLYVNAREAGTHAGYGSFSFDITDYVADGENTLALVCYDDTRSGKQPLGKQSRSFYSQGCDYTRTTGIWQTVWIEEVEQEHIESVKVTTDIHSGEVVFEAKVCGSGLLSAKISFAGEERTTVTCNAENGVNVFSAKVNAPLLWELGNSRLYDVEYTFHNDKVTSYFAFRDIRLSGNKVLFNDRPVFQRLVLDQGFYPDGIWTAPSDEDLKNDIIIQMQLGFNGARLHQKVFEERYLYWADKLGYMVWSEFPSWGLDITSLDGAYTFIPQWLEVVERDYNHPSIVCWCPFNETWDYNGKPADKRVLELVYLATKAYDPIRPVIDTSGSYHSSHTDIYDIHDYEQDAETVYRNWHDLKDGEIFDNFPDRQTYGGQPVMVSEYGGIWWAPGRTDGWGYGNAPETKEEYIQRYCAITKALLSSDRLCGFCFTQTTDVEQEQNGLYYYDRSEKFSPEEYRTIQAANETVAAIEK